MTGLKATLAQEDCLSGALEYYRQTFSGDKHLPELAELQQKIATGPIEVPSLYLHGKDDGCIGESLCKGMEAFFPKGLDIELIEGAGHFMHLEKPEQVNEIIKQFIL